MTQKSEKEFMLQFLLEEISIASVKGEPVSLAPFGLKTIEALEHFLAKAEADGFRTRRYDGYAGVIEWGPEDKNIIAGVCHLDVVPIGEWAEGFSPKFVNGQVIGRGSLDDKGPAIAVYMAMKRLKNANYPLQTTMQLILGLDEESGSQCMKYYCQKEANLPTAAFTADADFPVIHAEKGMCNFRISFDGRGQNENEELRLVSVSAGSRPNVIPGQCRLVWQNDAGVKNEVVIEGVMGHASMPEIAKNAISLAMHEAAKSLGEKGLSNDFVDFYNHIIGLSYSGEGLGIAQSDDVSGALTFNTGIVSYDGKKGELICDIRYPVTAEGEALIAQIEKAVQKAGGKFELLSHSPALYLPKDHPLVSSLASVYQKLSGTNEGAIAIGGGTYARSVPNTLAFGPSFPGEIGLAHQNGEYVELDSLYRSVDYYEEAFKALDSTFAKS